MNSFLYKKIILLSLLTPISLYSAATDKALNGVASIIDSFTDSVVGSLGTLMLTLGVVAFLWGMVQFIWAKSNGGDGDKMKVGQSFMAWGLLALFVMFSVWGIIEFFGSSLNIKTGGTVDVPSIQFKP